MPIVTQGVETLYDGRVSIYGNRLSEKNAARWMTDHDNPGMVFWMRRECEDARKNRLRINRHFYDADGRLQNA